MTIYHLAWRADWNAQCAHGEYRPPSLASEGFIHLTREPERVVWVANQFFAEPRDDELLLIRVDESKVGAPVRDEDPGIGVLFPHLYGALVLTAVECSAPMRRGPEGWRLPDET